MLAWAACVNGFENDAPPENRVVFPDCSLAGSVFTPSSTRDFAV
jgi:hypothetical protein